MRKVKENFESAVRTKKKAESYAFCVLNFRNQISQIVGRNLTHILNYSTFRKEYKENDLNESIAPIAEIDENKSIRLILILSTDGVSIKKSTFKKELWPVWLQIADLPPKLRMSRNNIILAALYVGAETPNWVDIVPHLRAELVSDIEVLDSDNLEITAKLKTVLLVSDLVAKPHILNMFQFNGYFGCHYCFAEGTTIGRTHSYYPHNQQAEIREPETNDKYVEIAEYGRSALFRNVAGIKGRSAFSSIINGLPLAAPIDYMHCILLGVFPDFLKLIAKSMSFGVKQKIDERVQNPACPREMIAFSRKIRCLDELPQFKANEVFNWLFYVGPIVFFETIENSLYEQMSILVYSLRLLMENSSSGNVKMAESLLKQFCENVVDTFGGNARIETINMHSLRHLADQVRRFGPLFTCSAMSFESANRILSQVFTGSHHELEVICRRFLQLQRFHDLSIENEQISDLWNQLLGTEVLEREHLDHAMRETDSLLEGRACYPNASFFNRQYFGNVYFDSPSFSRAPMSGDCNSFVAFSLNSEKAFGQIMYFVSIPGEPYHGKVKAVIQKYQIIEELGTVKGYLFRVRSTTEEVFANLETLRKVFRVRLPNMRNAESLVMKLCSVFEHS